MFTVNEIKEAIGNTDYEFYGIRIDEIKYNVGEIANNSHQLFQDPDFDEDGELIYPYIEDGIYEGFYDAGELSGTCTIGFNVEDEGSIQKALEIVKMYLGSYIHILGGYFAVGGNDLGELIISDAEVLMSKER